MKGLGCALVFALVVISAEVQAGDQKFVDTSEEIINVLTTPEQPYGPTRSFVIVEDPSRAIVVRTKEPGGVQDKQVLVREKDPAAVARMKIEFDVNSARLRTDSYQLLDQLGAALADERLAGRQVCIKGHTDSDGTERYNLGLSYDRAQAVRDYVVARHHLPTSDLFVVGYGEQLPLADNDSPTHKQLNRRVEITLGCKEIK